VPFECSFLCDGVDFRSHGTGNAYRQSTKKAGTAEEPGWRLNNFVLTYGAIWLLRSRMTSSKTTELLALAAKPINSPVELFYLLAFLFALVLLSHNLSKFV